MPTARPRTVRVVAILAVGGVALLTAWLLRPVIPDGLPPCTATSEAVDPPVTSRFLPTPPGFAHEPIEIAVTADGRIWFEGAAVDRAALEAGLAAEADRVRDLDHPSRPSLRPCVVWVDRHAPFGAMDEVRRAVHSPLVRIHDFHLAVRGGPGRSPRALYLPLPGWWGTGANPVFIPDPPIVRVGMEDGAPRFRTEAESADPLLTEIRPVDSGEVIHPPYSRDLSDLRGVVRRGLRWHWGLRLEVDERVPFEDALDILDRLEGFEPAPGTRGDLWEFVSGEARLSAPPDRAGSGFPQADDRHALALLFFALFGLAVLAATAAAPRGVAWIIGLKVPVAFGLVMAARLIGGPGHGDARPVAQWAVPAAIGFAIWVFSRPRLLRWIAPPCLALAGVVLAAGYLDLDHDPRYTGDPAAIARRQRAQIGREGRLLAAASRLERIDGLDPLPEGFLADLKGIDAETRRILRHVRLLDAGVETRWHTFLTGVYRVVTACPDLEIWSPGGPKADALNALEFRRRAPDGEAE